MNEKILIVDDDVNLLNSLRRQLRGKYELITASSGEEALEIILKQKEFMVIISDYKMPYMDGAEFLKKAREYSPESIRIMLTGQADMEAVVAVVNEGNIFRFLTKPCSPELFNKNISDAIEQYRLINAEKELLSKTLKGSIQVMTDLLTLAKPEAFNRSLRIKNIVSKMIKKMDVKLPWQIEIAAMLSQVGCITIPDSILTKVLKNINVTAEEKALYLLHTRISSELIQKIPRLEKVAEILAYQEKYFNGKGIPNDKIKGEDLPLGSRILRLVGDYDQLIQMDFSVSESIDTLKNREGNYDTSLIPILEKAIKEESTGKKYILKKLKISEINESMYLAKPVTTASGVIIGANKQKITKPLITTLMNYAKNNEIQDVVSVLTYVA